MFWYFVAFLAILNIMAPNQPLTTNLPHIASVTAAEIAEFKKNCDKCTTYGYQFCGKTTNIFTRTTCEKTINEKSCRLKVA